MPRTTSIGVGYMMKNRYESRKPVTKTAAEIVTVQRRTGTRAADSERLPAKTSSPMRPRAPTNTESQPPTQIQPSRRVEGGAAPTEYGEKAAPGASETVITNRAALAI